MAQDGPHSPAVNTQQLERPRYSSIMRRLKAAFRKNQVEPGTNPNEAPGSGIRPVFNRGRDAIWRVSRVYRNVVPGKTEIVSEVELIEVITPAEPRSLVPKDGRPVVVVADCELLHPEPRYAEPLEAVDYNVILEANLHDNADAPGPATP